MEKTFDYEQYKTRAVEGLLSGQPLTGTDGVLTPLIKEFLEAALAVELKAHIKTSKDYGAPNRRNGHMGKEVRSLGGGAFELETPRDRMGTEAIKTVFPKAVVQACVVHQIRQSIKFVSDKDMKAFMIDLKNVYQAVNRLQAEENLEVLDQNWGKKYAPVISSWRNNWQRLSAYFDYPPVIRKVMYTTNAIEGLNRQIRKITKTKGAFPSETALFKLVYLVIDEISKKKTNNIPNWGEIAGQLHIIFGERADIDIKRF